MSRTTETITLQAPEISTKEHFSSRPQQCPHCGGRGHFCPEGPNDRAPKCERCAGTGWLQAIVDIAWVPTDRSGDTPRVKQHTHGEPRTDWDMDEQTRLKILRR